MKLLLAYDHSEQSRNAANFALQLPFSEPIDLHVISAVAPPVFVDASASGFPIDIGPFLDVETKAAEKEVAEICEKLESHSQVQSVHSKIEIGQPSSVVVQYAGEQQIELVVLGALGHSAIGRMLLGSVSDYVATHAAANTLIVRPSGTNDTPPKIARIMLALSGSPADTKILDWMKQLSFKPDTEIHLVRVLDLFTFYRQDFRQVASESWQKQSETAHGEVLDVERELKKMGLATESHLIQADHVGEALVNYAERHEIDLAVTGDSDRGVLSRVFLGSVSRFVLRHANCSVLIARK